jgi:hypothetical protein
MPQRPRKLKLGKSSAFVKRQLSWLQHGDVIQEAGFHPLPAVFGDHGLWLGLAVSRQDGTVLAQEILDVAPDVNDLAKLLAHAMQRPLMGQGRCRPYAIHLRDNPEWQELYPHLEQLGIEVVLSEGLSNWDQVFADVIDYLGRGEWKQTVVNMAGDFEGGDGYPDCCRGLRLAVILYPAVRHSSQPGD